MTPWMPEFPKHPMGREVIETATRIIDSWAHATPSWRDIEELSMHHSAVHTMCVLVERGELSQHQALIRLVLGLARSSQQFFEHALDAVNRSPQPPFLIPASIEEKPP